MLFRKSKRVISVLLSATLLLSSMPLNAFAMSKEEIDSMDQVWIWESLHFDEITDEQQEKGVIYMGTMDATAEERGWYGLTIYRDGNVSEQATVELSTMDVSATLGVDYDYYNQEVTYHETAGTIMELNVGIDTEQLIADYDAYVQELADSQQDSINVTTENGVYTGDTTPEALELASVATGKSTLALLKEAQTGEATRAVESDQAPQDVEEYLAQMDSSDTSTSTNDAVDAEVAIASYDVDGVENDAEEYTEESEETVVGEEAVVDEVTPEQQEIAEALNQYTHENFTENMYTSSSLTVTFAPGQTEQYIAIEIIDDDEAEDDELAMFILSNPEGALLGDVINMTMAITDDEEHEPAYVSFTSEVTYLEGESGEITLQRTGADYYMVTAEVSLLDANNQKVGYETCVFYPYETTATLDVEIEGEGAYQAVITDLKACEAGNILATAVYFAEIEGSLIVDLDDAEPVVAVSTNYSTLSSDTDRVSTISATTTSFTLSGKTGTNGAALRVDYTGTKDSLGNNYGYIYDTGVTPEVAVGVYYFPATFSTGYTTFKPNNTSYSLQGSGVGSYIKMQWYSSTMKKKGTVYAQSKGVYALPFASVAADVTMVKDAYSNNKLTFTFGSESATKTSNFSRTLWTFTLDDDWSYIKNTTKTFKMQVIDDSSGTPNTIAYLYGYAAFYSSFKITVSQPGSMTFLNGADSSGDVNSKTVSYVPANASIGEGHETRYYNQSLQLISSTTDTTSSVIRGNLIGYSIKNTTYSNSKDIWYLANGKTTSDVDSANYLGATVINLASGTTVSNIAFDDEFLTNLYAQVSGAYSRKGSNALTVTPLYEYKDVEVLTRTVTIDGKSYGFTNLDSGSYHMGDVISLTAEAPEGYYYGGYTYSMRLSSNTNETASTGTVTVTANSSSTLTLGKSNMAYYDLEPIFIENSGNYIYFDASQDVYVPNTLTSAQIDLLQQVFPSYNFPDTNIYIAESDADSDDDAVVSGSGTVAQIDEAREILGQITVIPGKVYQIEAYTYSSTGVPTFSNAYQVGLGTTEVVTSNVFDFIALSELTQNKITVGSATRTSQQYYELTGEMFYANYSVRSSDALGYLESVPATGGTVYVDGEAKQRYITTSDNSTTTLSSYIERRNGTVDESGVYSVAGIYGTSGDTVSVYYTNGDIEKVYYVTLGDSDDCTATENHSMQFIQNSVNTSLQTNSDESVTITGTLLTRTTSDTLPIFTVGSPSVGDVNYTYDSSASTAEFGTVSNSVAIMDDYFDVTATIDLNGNTLSKVVFKVDKYFGQDVEYTVEATRTTQSVFTCSFGGKEMSEVFGDGDKLYLTMYDSEGKEVQTVVLDEDGEVVTNDDGEYTYTTSTIDVVYATVFTGLTFYIPTLEVDPQEFAVDASDFAVDIPVFGTVASSTTSGVLSFTKQEWTIEGLEEHQPYTLSFTGNANVYSPATVPSWINSFNTISQMAADASASAKEKIDNGAAIGDDGTSASKTYSESLQKMFKDNKVSVNIIVVLAFHYMYDVDLNQYVVIGGQAVVGGTYQITSNFYTTIYMVPVYIQLVGLVEVDVIVSYNLMEEGNETTITADDFSGYSNIAESMETGAAVYLHAMLKASVGVGICGVVGARGIVQVDAYGYIDTTDAFSNTWDKSGFKVSLSGGFALDLFVFTLSYTAEITSIGFGIYDPYASISSVQSMASDAITEDFTLSEVRMYNTGSENSVGESTSSVLSLIGDVNDYETLVSDTVERTRPQILQLNDGRQFLVYIGNNNDIPTLYYKIYNGTSWSDAKIVDADGTADTTPFIALYGDDVLISWADATGALDANDVAGSLALFDISVCRYDTSDGTMGNVQKLSDDAAAYGTTYADYSPVIAADPDGKAGAGILYIKRDTNTISSDEELLDTTTYETFVLAIWDGNDNATFTEDFISITGDPLVSDLNAVIMPNLVDNDDYLAMIYTIDKDGDYDTSTDQEIYLQFYNITTGEEKPAIPLTSNYVPDYAPQINKLESDEIFLTWLGNHTSTDANGQEQTYLFYMDLQEILDEIDSYYGLDTYFARTGDSWYYVPESDFTDTDYCVYEDSVFYLMSQYELVGDGIPMTSDGGSISLNEYLVLENGDDLYMLWTNAGSASAGDYSVELYGAMYHKPTDTEVDTSGTADSNGIYTDETEGERSGWSQPIKLTNFGDADANGTYSNTVLDEITACIDDNEFIIASNLFTQNLSNDNTMEYSDNNLVAYTIDTSAQLEVLDMQADPMYVVAGDTVSLYYTVYNAGMQPIEGYTGTVTIAGQAVDVSNDDWIFGGETVEMRAEVILENNLTDSDTLTASLTSGTLSANYSEAALYESNISYSHGTASQEDYGTITVPIIISNSGNKTSDAFTLTVSARDDDTALESETVTLDIPAIGAGETYTVSFSNSNILTRTDFGTYGYAEVNLTYEGTGTGTVADDVLDYGDSGTITQVLSIFQPSLSLNITIGNNSSEFYLEVGQTVAPATVRVGDDVISVDDVTITVEDESILSVSNTGYITTNKTGETKVTITCTFDGETYSKTVTVYVVDELYLQEVEESTDTDTESGTSSGSNTSSSSSSSSDLDDDDSTQSTSTPSYEQFNDILESDWFADAVTYVVEHGLFNGVSDDSFAPTDAMTRAMLITVLWNMSGNPDSDLSSTFSDTPESMWYYEAVAWAIAEGVTNGISDTEFGPDLELTREQLVVLLYRFAGSPEVTGNLTTYTDASSVSDWASDAMIWAVKQGIVSGTTATTLSPQSGATRAEVATMMMRYLKNLES